jgi:hypothetical protein
MPIFHQGLSLRRWQRLRLRLCRWQRLRLCLCLRDWKVYHLKSQLYLLN